MRGEGQSSDELNLQNNLVPLSCWHAFRSVLYSTDLSLEAAA